MKTLFDSPWIWMHCRRVESPVSRFWYRGCSCSGSDSAPLAVRSHPDPRADLPLAWQMLIFAVGDALLAGLVIRGSSAAARAAGAPMLNQTCKPMNRAPLRWRLRFRSRTRAHPRRRYQLRRGQRRPGQGGRDRRGHRHRRCKAPRQPCGGVRQTSARIAPFHPPCRKSIMHQPRGVIIYSRLF